MKKTHTLLFSVVFAALLVSGSASGQSATTETLYKQYSGALTFFFYNNTLRMLNQTEDKEFDALIKDIEKMRFLLIRRSQENFGEDDYRKLVANYQSEQFEAVMTSRYAGKSFNVYMKEKDGKTKAMLVLVNDTDNLYVLDILGRIALDKITSLYEKLDESADIGKKIQQFTGGE